MALFIYIPTTEGPSQILSLTAEDDDVQSVVCLNNSTTTLPISSGYHQFVRKGSGIIHQAFGHGAFRLDVSARVDQGNSWQLAVYLAHAAHSKGLLGQGTPGAGDTLIWASAELSKTGEVLPISQLADKIRLSQPLLQQAEQAGASLLLLCASQNAAELQTSTDWPVTAVDQLQQALAAVFPAKAASQLQPAAARQRPSRNRHYLVAGTAVSVLCLAAWFYGWYLPQQQAVPGEAGLYTMPLQGSEASQPMIGEFEPGQFDPGQASTELFAAVITPVKDPAQPTQKDTTLQLHASYRLISPGQPCSEGEWQQSPLTAGKPLLLPGHRLCALQLQSVHSLMRGQWQLAVYRLPPAAQPYSRVDGWQPIADGWQWPAPYPGGEQRYLLVLHPGESGLNPLQLQFAQWQQQEQRFGAQHLATLYQHYPDWVFFQMTLQGF